MTPLNISNVSNIYSKTIPIVVTTTPTTFLSNPTASNSVIKVTTLVIGNVNGVSAASITFYFTRGSVTVRPALSIPIPAGTSLVLISKDDPINLEEGDLIGLTASVNSSLEGLLSYEVMS